MTAIASPPFAAAPRRRERRTALLVVAALALTLPPAQGQTLPDQRQRLVSAKRAAALAGRRAADLARRAAAERDAADKARAEEAALAARVTAAEANLAAAQARQAIVARLLADQRATLGRAQAPVARLLAALTALARRPTIVAIAQPGSVDDLVHVRAVLGGTLPVVHARTQAVRDAIARSRTLQADARLAAAALRDGRARLEADRTALARLEATHRRRAQALGRGAMSESDRALALGERARDLVDSLDERDIAQATAADLGRLPGPSPRPLAPGATMPPPPLRGAYRLPVRGRLVTGLDELSDAGIRSRGLTFAVAADAPVVAPAAGRVRYARVFRGFGTIVILDHGDGWTSLVTGLATADVAAGQRIAAGTPIGRAGTGDDPRVTVELRRRGRPMDIAALLG
ncbi:peptidoglycan DD-metalloendopeptidase family protein [Sphingomonas sp. A2-49]|uniref:murein hydrolase activator EnvC family protein n=1 Tax=Sphingomonas sp. A2-49 TaxID=1391375 RepID=UPI0021D3A6CE|nr:peptidoglycan DD-metalloendopeptidase family protein [Sphingomonas sp. A2-49]MCU6454256.1 peptidoglycan DD-metalloendopeptidase family protein [Sphingomonas sp. A2-49]